MFFGYLHQRRMNEGSPLHWCSDALRKLSCHKLLLLWHSHEAHLTDDIKKMLNNFKIETFIIPGGCTKYVKTPGVV